MAQKGGCETGVMMRTSPRLVHTSQQLFGSRQAVIAIGAGGIGKAKSIQRNDSVLRSALPCRMHVVFCVGRGDLVVTSFGLFEFHIGFRGASGRLLEDFDTLKWFSFSIRVLRLRLLFVERGVRLLDVRYLVQPRVSRALIRLEGGRCGVRQLFSGRRHRRARRFTSSRGQWRP